VVGWACTRGGKTVCYGIKVGARQVSPMREIVRGPCQLIFASSRFLITPSVWMSPSIHRATHADTPTSNSRKLVFALFFTTTDAFYFNALLNLQLPLARREDEVWLLNPYITESTPSTQRPHTRAFVLFVGYFTHPISYCYASYFSIVVPISFWYDAYTVLTLAI
jgi:hypothetical protein